MRGGPSLRQPLRRRSGFDDAGALERVKVLLAPLAASATLTRSARSRRSGSYQSDNAACHVSTGEEMGRFGHRYRLQNCGLTDRAIALHHGFTMFFSLA